MKRATYFVLAELACVPPTYLCFYWVHAPGWALVFFILTWFFGLCALLEFARVMWLV